jgi:hypothetical protein
VGFFLACCTEGKKQRRLIRRPKEKRIYSWIGGLVYRSTRGDEVLGRNPAREIPSFFILAINVVRFRPSLAAAPVAPPITQPAASSICNINECSESLRVVYVRGDNRAVDVVEFQLSAHD